MLRPYDVVSSNHPYNIFMDCDKKEIEYVVMDPSKNITILVLTEVPKVQYGNVAKRLLEVEKSAEQVGFLTYDGKYDINICMAGGEFCGNATMSAAAYFALKNGKNADIVRVGAGLSEPVKVKVKLIDGSDFESHSSTVRYDIYEGIVEMPALKEVKEVKFPCGETFPVVFFNGIAHIMYDRYIKVDEYELSEELKKYLEENIKKWCEFLKMPAVGVMVLSGIKACNPYKLQLCNVNQVVRDDDAHIVRDYDNVAHIVRDDEGSTIVRPYDKVIELKMIPLVYVKSVDTLYWESSCASGTTAVGAYFAKDTNKCVNINVRQPSGEILNITCENDGRLLLKGKVKYLYSKSIII